MFSCCVRESVKSIVQKRTERHPGMEQAKRDAKDRYFSEMEWSILSVLQIQAENKAKKARIQD
jgi:hypothetical protein